MSTEPQPAKNSSWLLRLILLIAGLCVVSVLAIVVWNWTLSRQINSRLEKIRAAGEIVTLKELNAYYPAVPPEKNAALIYGQAFTALNKSSSRKFLEHLDELPHDTNALPDALRQPMEKAVSENQSVIETLRKASQLPACRYPVDYEPGWAALLPQLSYLQTCVKLELCNGILQEQQGDTDAAITSAIFISKYARSLDTEPDLISVVIQQKLDWKAFDLFEWLLNHRRFSREQLLRFQEVITNSEQKDWLTRAAVGERSTTLAIFDYSVAGFLSVIAPNDDSLALAFSVWLSKHTGQAKRDEIAFIDRFAQIRELSKLDLPERLDRLEELRAEIRREAVQHAFFATGGLLPGFMNGFVKDAEHIAHTRLAQTALAVELFRLDHGGALPAQLDELVPSYLPKVPSDPFDGKQLRYKKQNEGYLLYSIGPDRTDDDGELRLLEKSKPVSASTPSPSGDIVFSVGK